MYEYQVARLNNANDLHKYLEDYARRGFRLISHQVVMEAPFQRNSTSDPSTNCYSLHRSRTSCRTSARCFDYRSGRFLDSSPKTSKDYTTTISASPFA